MKCWEIQGQMLNGCDVACFRYDGNKRRLNHFLIFVSVIPKRFNNDPRYSQTNLKLQRKEPLFDSSM